MDETYLGNTSSAVLSIFIDSEEKRFNFNTEFHNKPIDFHCKTYKDQAYVGKKTFTSVYTEDPLENVLILEINPTYDVIACSLEGVFFSEMYPILPLPAGKQISYTFYKDFAAAATETEAAKAGGVVITFKPDQKISKNDFFEVGVLYPFAQFIRNGGEKRKCAVDPPVENFRQVCNESAYLCFSGSFEANQKYVVTCPDVKVELPYAKDTYTVATSGYLNAQTGIGYSRDPKMIEFFNAASFTTILGSVVLAASALIALF